MVALNQGPRSVSGSDVDVHISQQGSLENGEVKFLLYHLTGMSSKIERVGATRQPNGSWNVWLDANVKSTQLIRLTSGDIGRQVHDIALERAVKYVASPEIQSTYNMGVQDHTVYKSKYLS